jgi:DNA-binding SARP family transcriptional activator
MHALDQAEGAIRAREPQRAYGWAGVASAIARRPFLPGEAGLWLDEQRARLRQMLVRALECFTEIFTWNHELTLATQAAEEILALEPFRESAYQRLMQVHAAMGNRADALRTYQRCRTLLAEELGVDPSPQTEAVYLQILAAN